MKNFTFILVLMGVVLLGTNVKIAYEEQTLTQDELLEMYRVNELECKYDELVVTSVDDEMCHYEAYNDGKFCSLGAFNIEYYEYIYTHH